MNHIVNAPQNISCKSGIHKSLDSIRKYLKTYGVSDRWPLVAASTEGLDQAVIIPALAERESIFATLAAIAKNPAADIRRTLVVCVINNGSRKSSSREILENNDATLKVLGNMVERNLPAECRLDTSLGKDLREILDRGLRVAFVDAASPGCELPCRGGGVGMARKIGMDRALDVLAREGKGKGLLLSLDADTLVEENYLPAVRSFFTQAGGAGAVIAYSHEIPASAELQAAICCYDIFLRYYVLGLHWAGSPYAFPSIGSTMVCTARSYAAVRGMNRLPAGEDFYFLNKLAKVGAIGQISETVVHPAARLSWRVPFGTGQRMIRFLDGSRNEYTLYDPHVFLILRQWLENMASAPDRDGNTIQAKAQQIHPLLASFLTQKNFATLWDRIRKNNRRVDFLQKQFLCWFDGFMTLKLIHYLTEHGFPPVAMFPAAERLLEMVGRKCPVRVDPVNIPEIDDQRRLLSLLYLDASSPFSYTAQASKTGGAGKPGLTS